MKKELLEKIFNQLETIPNEKGIIPGECPGYPKLKEFMKNNKILDERMLKLDKILVNHLSYILTKALYEEDLFVATKEKIIENGEYIEITSYEDEEKNKKATKLNILSSEEYLPKGDVQIALREVVAEKINDEEYKINIKYKNKWYNSETKEEVYNKETKESSIEKKPKGLEETRFILSTSLKTSKSILENMYN